MAYQSINPYTGEKGVLYELFSADELDRIIERCSDAQNIWKKRAVAERAVIAGNLAEILESRSEEYGRIITKEMGKPYSQAVAEVEKCALACRYYESNGAGFLETKPVSSSQGVTRLRYDPLGIILAIMPWNFPFWQVIRCIVPALVSGNGVLLKHASNVPDSALAIENAVREAGFPDQLFRNLFITHDQVNRVIEHTKVSSVSLTGSNIAGARIASAAGSSVKRCVLELGGSDPFIVFPDADIKRSVEGAITGRFQNNGQSCIATKRIYLHRDIFNEFASLFVERVKSLKVGDPMDPEVYIGPMVNRAAAEELAGQVTKSVQTGARLLCGSGKPEGKGSLFTPTVLADIADDSPVATEETFGPVVPLFSFSDYSEVIRRVNSSRFGLGASVWTGNSDLAMQAAADIESGTVTINGFTRSDPAVPFGGIKESGYGRELSDLGLYEFVNIKSITNF
jgi:succinate-semialdehyde dehydrogenase/glutarate-semialdehyde dehydrogenase